MTDTAMTKAALNLRWQDQLYECNNARWSSEELDGLKYELNRRASLGDEFFRICADAIGSVQFDLVDARLECRKQ